MEPAFSSVKMNLTPGSTLWPARLQERGFRGESWGVGVMAEGLSSGKALLLGGALARPHLGTGAGEPGKSILVLYSSLEQM